MNLMGLSFLEVLAVCVSILGLGLGGIWKLFEIMIKEPLTELRSELKSLNSQLMHIVSKQQLLEERVENLKFRTDNLENRRD